MMGTVYETAEGSSLQIGCDGDRLTVNGITMVLKKDIVTTNGVIHLIDQVLVPDSGTARAEAHAHTYTYTFTCMYTHTHMLTYIRTNARTSMYVNKHIHTRAHTYTHTHTYISCI